VTVMEGVGGAESTLYGEWKRSQLKKEEEKILMGQL